MKTLRKIFSGIIFVGGAVFGLLFAQNKGTDLRKKINKAIKKGDVANVLSKEAQNIGKDIWQSAVGMKDVKEVQEFIAESQARLTELGEDAKNYGGEVAKVLAQKYAQIAKQLEKQAKDLEKSAKKEVKKTVKKAKKMIAKSVKKAQAKKKPVAKKITKKAPQKPVKKVVKKVTKKPARKTTKKAKK